MDEREIREQANYIVENNATVRGAALVFGVSKSTIHVHVTKQLKKIWFTVVQESEKSSW